MKKLSSDLEYLLKVSLADGKITDKERKVVFDKAIEEGWSEMEFSIVFDQMVKDRKHLPTRLMRKWKNMNSSVRLALIGVVVLGLIAFGISTCVGNRQAELIERYGCTSVEECLGEFKFEGARALASSGDMADIVTAEQEYWVKNGDFDRAMNVVREWRPGGYEGDQKLQYKLMYQVCDACIDDLLKKRDWVEAYTWAQKASPEHDITGGELGFWNSSESQVDVLQTKIYEVHKVIDSDEAMDMHLGL
jgi:hypothetical protein